MTRAYMLVTDLLLETAARVPEKIAITSSGESISYRELVACASSLAGALAASGVARGDRVVIAADNAIAPVVAFWAALIANAIPVVLHPQTKPARLERIIDDSGARIVIADPRVARGAPADTATLEIGGARWMDATARGGSAPMRACIDFDLAAIVYTSGSTGEPKGAAFSHRNVLATNASISAYLEIDERDVILSALPLAFGYGLYQMIMAIAAGARIVLERSFAYPAEVLHHIAAERATGFPGVPTMFAALLRAAHAAELDLSSLRYVTSAAAALPTAQLRALAALVPRAKIFSMYGQTECMRCSYLPPELALHKPDSVGIAIPNTELWIEDEHGRQLGPHQVGELVVRGGHVMQGYWNRPDESARKLRPGRVPGERVLHTGDLFCLDGDGHLYFVARTDDVIKSGGEKVAPKQVEDALLAIAGVLEAAVVGVPHELLGQAIRAFVVLEPGAALDTAALHRACRTQLEGFMVPHEIVIRGALPRSLNGKVQKTELT